MTSDFVTVVVPAYNAAQYLKQTLESVISQTYRNFEIIVVDDGSTDGTPHVAQQFGDAVQYIRQDNRGLSAARNVAIKKARAGVIALLDADDIWEPQFLEKMSLLLNLHPEAAGVYCGFQYINSEGDIVGKPSLKVVPPEFFHTTMADGGNWLAPCAVLFRKRLAEEVGLFDESLRAVEDWDLWIRLSERQPFIGLPEALVRYRRHENNMSKDPERMINAIYRLTEKRFGPDEGSAHSWSSDKTKAFVNHYRGAAIMFFAAGRLQESVDYLQRLAEISPEYACSISVWRALAGAYIPDEYQFEPMYQHDWALMETNLNQLLCEVASKAKQSKSLKSLFPRIKGFAFLAMADEAGRAGELGRACNWLRMVILAYPRMLIVRPFWGTAFRSIMTAIIFSSKILKPKVTN